MEDSIGRFWRIFLRQTIANLVDYTDLTLSSLQHCALVKDIYIIFENLTEKHAVCC